MDATKGIHALATMMFTFLIAYFVYGWVESFFNSVTDTTLKYVFWGSYIIILLVCLIGVPALIAFGEDSDASVISACGGLAFYFGGVLFMRIFHPLMSVFIGDTGITLFSADQFSVQIVSFLYLLGILFSLFIGPIVVATMPELVQSAAKQVMEAAA